MSEEAPQSVGQLRSKAYEFWKERENQSAPSYDTTPRSVSGKQKASTVEHIDRPQRPLLPPNKPGSSTVVIASAIKAGSKRHETGESAESSEELLNEVPFQPKSSPAPPPFSKKKQLSAGTLGNSKVAQPKNSLTGQSSTWSNRSDSTSSYGDASSYMPKGSKQIQGAGSDKVKNHTKVAKSVSTPGEAAKVLPEVKKLSSSWGRTSTIAGCTANVVPLRPKKYVPRIETIRASTGDRLSKDDLDLLPVERTGRVEALTREINTSLLVPRQHQAKPSQSNHLQLLAPPVSRKRHASTGEADVKINGVRKEA